MKLYVFLVNTGITLTFDTELAVQTVNDLKHAIQTKYKIAVQHQILVVNGGECMAPDRRVCSYSAGTDTNPIFLFNKEMILCERPPVIPRTTFSAENEMELKVEESLMMPAVFHTVASRTQLAVEMYEVAKKLCSFCEGLVHDEHLQHQGWAAIMANLEDCTHSYQKLLFKFENAYSKYIQSIDDIKVKLTNLGTAVSVMAKIPLLECLTRHSYRMCLDRLISSVEGDIDELENEKTAELVQCGEETKLKNMALLASINTSGERTTQEVHDNRIEQETMDSYGQDSDILEGHLTTEGPFNVSLLDWINVQDRPNDVESLVRKCFDSMSRLDPRIIQPFLAESRQTVAKLDNQNMKAIKGLEDRLYALDQMIASCSRLVNEQKELAQGFLANQKRAENLKDPSVLPDLCLSHANQLMIMLTNHRKLLDIKQKCTTAKQELANNLQVRLKWCCFVMLHADQDGEKIQALFRLLMELLERVKIVEALSTVPQMYCLAVVEVVRRKMFVKHYREWANALVKDGKSLYENEKAKRETFGKLFRKSYLRNRLFRGLDSWPSSFCTRKPRKFDSELPDISVNDLQFLQSLCPPEVQLFLRVPLLCDFEPLHQHVRALHNLVKAAQSLDEMSQTITDLLNEQKVSNGQVSPQSATTPRIESAAEATTTTSSKSPPSLSLQGPICPSVSIPAPLEELSPDSIDAHTFDFETIPHPHIEQSLKQGSLDLDSLTDSPESDFMSAVNEFVIEENPVSPNISDTQSPEMMVESLYSSVINAIDSRRMQNTKGGKHDSAENISLKACVDRCKVVAQESQANLRNFREELCQLKILVQKEQSEFASAIKSVSAEILKMVQHANASLENALKEKHFEELQLLEKSYEKRLQLSKEDLNVNEEVIKQLKNDITGLKEDLQTKQTEVAAVKSENETFLHLQNERDQKMIHLESAMREQMYEMQTLKESRETTLEDLKKLHAENEEKLRLLKEEFKVLEQTHLKELEDHLQLRHAQELEDVKVENKCCIEKLQLENKQKVGQLQESSAAVVKDKDFQLQELNLRISELSDIRCKLEVELALKEGEVDEMKLIMEENKAQQQDTLNYQVGEETEILKKEIIRLNNVIKNQKGEHEQGLEELKILLTMEKEQCISQMLYSHEAQTKSLQRDSSTLTTAHQQALERESRLREELNVLQTKLEDTLKVLETQTEQHEKAVKEQKEMYEATIQKLEEDREQKLEKETLPQKFTCEKEDAAHLSVKDFELHMQNVEKELSEKVQLLQQQFGKSPPGATYSLISELQETLQHGKQLFVEHIDLQERRKAEELQSLRISLIAEQQTNFNTVLTREKVKKENIICDLSEKLKSVTLQQDRDKALIETLSEDRAHLLQEKKKLEEDVGKLQSLVSSTHMVFPSEPAGACAPDPSSEINRPAYDATVIEEDRMEPTLDTSMTAVQDTILSEEKQKILLLERTLQLKEEENKRLNQRLMSQSMSSVSSRHSEKIAIRDFQVGDLVLIILDERHDNYVLFTVSPTLYFLHSESLTALDLKPASGSSRRPWVLGKVMEKEYCQAKKAQNRFKVPLGTKFYRVKAVPWNKKV
ncbi:PREDICTED: RB1-inducible coiled-coil protein 1 isoform X2 [Nanorana parkeri]|uniref:RB1-inducible coiled-coil protein 1 isoform X2 n=1 Tax=Nanorana parkeri TaxID=125878 RepID=UPI0008548C51|nr:PREDICTED: RB1-inducible coiled-coil protein 1 isoform X2 [Nanorana parkeri]